MEKKLDEIAEILGGTVIGDGNVVIHGVKGIDEANEGDLTFVANPKYRKNIETTGASAILVSAGIEDSNKNLVVVKDPYIALAKILNIFYPEQRDAVKISEKAFIADGAEIAEDTTIYPGVYIGHGAKIESGVILYPGVFVGNEVMIGKGSILYSNVSVYRKCIIGKRVILHTGVVVGSDGFGFANPGVDNLKVPQIGFVQIDDDVEIGANTTIDRGTLGRTWIKRGVKIDNLVQIAHNVEIGEKSIIVAQVGISGSTKLGRSVILGGQVGLVGHLSIGDNVMVGAQSGVPEDISPNQVVSGSPHMPHRKWLRVQALLPKLPEMRKTLTSLLKRVEKLEQTKT